ncbi:GNAT family N-acetyltransferase [Sphingomonas oleivorans]|uniref:GNAT family N-acetyltransferase n=1 Tax=Sphingomonas oleivorans TaxID=1735121 RepID=A0A2T5G2W6_9SPHN|nr:GNAT family N-acetyltransferase [Sphingomonas oleivorans]PTQ13492.1 GNAT family N-acetyltransferase [Sphingomonas oleivorans]
MSIVIRRAAPGDAAELLRLIKALARYEREPDAVKATEESLGQTLFGENPQVFAHIVEMDGRVRGIALWFLTYSTWTGRPSLYLEDLFVEEEARGTGAGRALFRVLAQEAKARGCARIDWAVLDWNEPARGFYRSMGGFHSEGWQPWRMEGEALERLAE